MKKAIKIIIIIAVLILIILAAARIATGEDSWICQDGKWIKHGFPSSEKPGEPCEESFIQKILMITGLNLFPAHLEPYPIAQKNL